MLITEYYTQQETQSLISIARSMSQKIMTRLSILLLLLLLLASCLGSWWSRPLVLGPNPEVQERGGQIAANTTSRLDRELYFRYRLSKMMEVIN